MNRKVECVEVKIKVPKQVVDYVEAFAKFGGIDIEGLWTDLVVSNVNSLTDGAGYPYIDREQLLKHYGLEKILGH